MFYTKIQNKKATFKSSEKMTRTMKETIVSFLVRVWVMKWEIQFDLNPIIGSCPRKKNQIQVWPDLNCYGSSLDFEGCPKSYFITSNSIDWSEFIEIYFWLDRMMQCVMWMSTICNYKLMGESRRNGFELDDWRLIETRYLILVWRLFKVFV